MSENWAEEIAEQLLSRGTEQTGTCLILGAVDTGKTTLATALAGRWSEHGSVGVIDADIGQSHIGPPTTVGWGIVDKPQLDLSQLTPGGISFVGDITPVGHLLQLTAAIAQCVQRVSQVTKGMIIDTPGFISGPAASALWWTAQRILQPELILAVQRENELNDILAGLQNLGSRIELVQCPLEIPTKSPQARRSYRQSRYSKYFRDSRLYDTSSSNISIQTSGKLNDANLISRLVALRNEEGIDLAIGAVNDWQADSGAAVIRAPELDMSQVCCLVIGDASLDLADE